MTDPERGKDPDKEIESFTAMITATIILFLLCVLIASDSGETDHTV